MVRIEMKMPEKCYDCIFADDNCSCTASDCDGARINVGNAYRTGRRDIRCPLTEVVMCKDCKYRRRHCSDDLFGNPLYECKHPDLNCEYPTIHEGYWFCADGEKKDEEKGNVD